MEQIVNKIQNNMRAWIAKEKRNSGGLNQEKQTKPLFLRKKSFKEEDMWRIIVYREELRQLPRNIVFVKIDCHIFGLLS